MTKSRTITKAKTSAQIKAVMEAGLSVKAVNVYPTHIEIITSPHYADVNDPPPKTDWDNVQFKGNRKK